MVSAPHSDTKFIRRSAWQLSTMAATVRKSTRNRRRPSRSFGPPASPLSKSCPCLPARAKQVRTIS